MSLETSNKYDAWLIVRNGRIFTSESDSENIPSGPHASTLAHSHPPGSNSLAATRKSPTKSST